MTEPSWSLTLKHIVHCDSKKHATPFLSIVLANVGQFPVYARKPISNAAHIFIDLRNARALLSV